MKTYHNTHTTLIISIFTIAILSSCNKDEVDNTQPIITIDEPMENDTLYIGSDAHFECDFSDDTELSSYKIEIHNDFDEHSHVKSISIEEDSVAFSYQNSWSFDEGLKNTHIHHHEIVIPETIGGVRTAQGNYHFGIYCTDIAGNESHQFIDVILVNGEDPHEED
ncbi:DUF4625 domain-containing protein [Sunxiuqinia indica]|uniref:DUF4625 domain-containing protein n=1 Tax=Sunxiuqinia indica TaxID=2692584 RepID=UPI001356D707|nr:DUF4625 domain-containing protein [Sunxiuqinia indica]